jgi:glycosyltransferase involved in cell wall biosynthesis
MRGADHKIRVSMLTPWDQVCGNAEYAKRLVRGLSDFADVTPHEMRNISDGYDDDGRVITRRELNRDFARLEREVNAARADIVHLQHEFAFFGRSPSAADRRFLSLVRNLRGPLVVTLHTFTPGMLRVHRRRLLGKLAERVLHWRRTRRIRAALGRADAIILHSTYTQRLLTRAFPELKRKIHVIPIAIEALPPSSSGRWQKPEGDRWIVIPGFVSRYKGHDRALAALEHLPARCKLVVAGGIHPKDPASAETWMEILGRADALGVRDRLLFSGFLEDPGEQAELFGKADAFLLPYNEVGQSGSAALADVMAYGRPVVTSFAKSMFVYRMDSDTVSSSVSVDVKDPERLAACLSDCLAGDGGRHDPRQQAVAGARYGLGECTRAYERVYRSLLPSAGSAR